MGIQNIPPSYAEFEKFSADYERKHFTFAETNQRVGSSTRDLFASWFPRIFTPIVRYSIYAILDDRNRTYPKGYDIAKLGPPKLVAQEERKAHPT